MQGNAYITSIYLLLYYELKSSTAALLKLNTNTNT